MMLNATIYAASGLEFLVPCAMPTVHARAIKRAVEIVGVDEFCNRAKISPADLALCIAGKLASDMEVFLVAVDILSEHAANASLRKKSSRKKE